MNLNIPETLILDYDLNKQQGGFVYLCNVDKTESIDQKKNYYKDIDINNLIVKSFDKVKE